METQQKFALKYSSFSSSLCPLLRPLTCMLFLEEKKQTPPGIQHIMFNAFSQQQMWSVFFSSWQIQRNSVVFKASCQLRDLTTVRSPWLTLLAWFGFCSETSQDTTSCACQGICACRSEHQGEEVNHSSRNRPCRRPVSTHDKAPEALIFPSLTHFIWLFLSPPCISLFTSEHLSLASLHDDLCAALCVVGQHCNQLIIKV